MKWIQAIQQQFSQHKYAINAKILGDDAPYAWTNLGYWTATTQSYPQACRQLADQLALAVALNSKDRLLDLGCGQGASVLHWQNNYKIQKLSAVDIQLTCIEQLQKNLDSNIQLYCGSFLNLKTQLTHSYFDVVLCIDAAYHSDLNDFLSAVSSVLKPQGRLGFHYLMLSDTWQQRTRLQEKQYQYLLKAADVSLEHLSDHNGYMHCLAQHHFENIQIVDISTSVLQGFSHYIKQLSQHQQAHTLDWIKIKMTAALCQKLYDDGLIRYVQISASNQSPTS